MLYLAAAALGSLTITVLAFAGILARVQRAHARREDLLINQLLHASGRSWQPAPADTQKPSPEELRERVLRFTPSPEQLPVQ